MNHLREGFLAMTITLIMKHNLQNTFYHNHL